MATLVQFLVAGVKGAEGGTATFVLRGTASSAASILYNDFEESAQPGTNIITLDSNGAAEVYCDAYCDVTLKTSGGSTLRTVTLGNSATTCEVVSDSFTGTSYSGSPTAVSQPITLAAVMNKWNDSAGSAGIDWKVAIGGIGTNLSSAFAALAGLFFNVRDPAFGAAGDGVTDDTTAIGLAITAASAAGGGIVFFPPTTTFYKITTLTVSAANITLMGCGPKASLIKSATTGSTILSFTDTTAGSFAKMVGIGLQGTGANASPLVGISAEPNMTFENCSFNSSTFTGFCISRTSTAGVSNIKFINCLITIGASNTSAIFNAASDEVANIIVTDCKFVIPNNFVGNVIKGPNFVVKGCTFDGSAQVAGGYYHVFAGSNDTAHKYLGIFTDNVFRDGGGASFVFSLNLIATGSDFTENNNKFEGFAVPTLITSAGNIYDLSHNSQDAYKVHLGSRKGRTIEITHASTGTVVVSSLCAYENVFINYTAAGNLTVQAPTAVMTNGAEANLVIQNNNASSRDITMDYGSALQTYGVIAGDAGPGVGGDEVLTLTNTERAVIFMKFMHYGTGAPLAFIPVPATD